MSSAPSFGGPGGHIFDVVAQVVKKHVFTVIYSHACTAVSREGLASIVKAYSRLIPVDGLVL